MLRVGFLLAAGAIYTTASDLNLLLSGEKEAMHLGVDVRRVRSSCTSQRRCLLDLRCRVSGAIGYVGLLVPHVMRRFSVRTTGFLFPRRRSEARSQW